MERYEAILEQLKKAQSRGMETITNRLDFAVTSLEELIQEAKSTVQGALPESADEVLPVDEIKAALDAYREEAKTARSRAEELEAKLADLAHVDEGASHNAPIELVRALESAGSQSELLKELLPAISDHAARAVVLVLRDGKVSAWSGIGFTDGEVLRNWQGEAAESAALAKLLEVSQPVRFTPSDDDLFNGWLTDETAPNEILLIPVVLRGKLMGTVYADRLEGQPWNPETVQVLVAQVCWLIDTLQYRTAAAPSLAVPVTLEQAAEVIEPEEPRVEEEATPDGEPEPVDHETADEIKVEVQDVDITPEAEPVADESATIEEEPGVEEPQPEPVEVDPSATMRVDVSGLDVGEVPIEGADHDAAESIPEAEAEADVVEEEEEEGIEPDESVEAVAETEIAAEAFEPEQPVEPEFDSPPTTEFEPETQVEPPVEEEPEPPVDVAPATPEPADIPVAVQMPVVPPEPEEEEEEPEAASSKFLDEPPPVQPVQPPPDEPEQEISEDEAQREEARRFARLLVSEIKLYNEEQVERGRESGDIYHRLREDIDRSREMFDKRISAEVRANQDYFTDELVRILADGDPNALGT